MSMFIVIDFDGVLFDDRAFKRDYSQFFGQYGIPPDVYKESYQATKAANQGLYRQRDHIRRLKKFYTSPALSSLHEDAEKFAARSKKYVYPEAKHFLATLKRRGASLVLLSWGDAFQKTKIEKSGLADFFDKIKIITRAAKAKPILQLLKKGTGKAVFIDDRREVIDEVKRKVPNLMAIQVIRHPDQEKSALAYAVIRNLLQAEKLLGI